MFCLSENNFKKTNKWIMQMKTDKVLFKETWGTEHSSHLCCFEIACLARTNSHSLEKTLRWGHHRLIILNVSNWTLLKMNFVYRKRNRFLTIKSSMKLSKKILNLPQNHVSCLTSLISKYLLFLSFVICHFGKLWKCLNFVLNTLMNNPEKKIRKKLHRVVWKHWKWLFPLMKWSYFEPTKTTLPSTNRVLVVLLCVKEGNWSIFYIFKISWTEFCSLLPVWCSQWSSSWKFGSTKFCWTRKSCHLLSQEISLQFLSNTLE